MFPSGVASTICSTRTTVDQVDEYQRRRPASSTYRNEEHGAMHEVSIAGALLRTLEDSAQQAGLTRVTRVSVDLGANAGVSPEALTFALEVVSKGTMAEGAEVMISGAALAGQACTGERGDSDQLCDCDHNHKVGEQHQHLHEDDHDDEALMAALQQGAIRLAWIEGT
jgi:hydrogenase nickel incorporation protein HypA/HybF